MLFMFLFVYLLVGDGGGRGHAVQAGSLRVLFPMESFEFFNYIILTTQPLTEMSA
jgi:hypothetical protein